MIPLSETDWRIALMEFVYAVIDGDMEEVQARMDTLASDRRAIIEQLNARRAHDFMTGTVV